MAENSGKFLIKYFPLKRLRFRIFDASGKTVAIFSRTLPLYADSWKRFDPFHLCFSENRRGGRPRSFNIRTHIPAPVNSRWKGEEYLVASSVSLRHSGSGGIGVGGSASRIASCRAAFAFPCTFVVLAQQESRTKDGVLMRNRFAESCKKKPASTITKPILSPRLAPILSNQRG